MHTRLTKCMVSLDMRCCLSWPDSGENVQSASHFDGHRRLIGDWIFDKTHLRNPSGAGRGISEDPLVMLAELGSAENFLLLICG